MLSKESIDQRNKIILAHRDIVHNMRSNQEKIVRCLEKDDDYNELEKENDGLADKIEFLIKEYWAWIRPVKLGTCPFCQKELRRNFDPIDLEGFWWMDRTQMPKEEPEACEHFRLLLGSVDRKGESYDPLFEGDPGPEQPFVIERILNMPSMQAVISSISMVCGYTAYPICYFSQQEVQRNSLTQSWGKKMYLKQAEDGSSGWDITDEEYEFDLSRWDAKDKVCFLT